MPAAISPPTTVSAEWSEYWARMGGPDDIPDFPEASDVEGWRQRHAMREVEALELSAGAVQMFRPDIAERRVGGVRALEIIPRDLQDSDSVVLYFHGGAYTTFTADSTLQTSALFADRTGRRVLSIDYTCAPNAKWNTITAEALSTYQALLAGGVIAPRTALFGDSAGGGLAAACILRMHDAGLPLPAALVLWSPWVDVTRSGDTYETLREAEPRFDFERHLRRAAQAYAEPEAQRHPHVSPVYGDFSRGFPPTLIQGGTREILLSNFVRFYQALEEQRVEAKLDIYEGMPHVFQNKLPASPESLLALRKCRGFLDRHLAN